MVYPNEVQKTVRIAKGAVSMRRYRWNCVETPEESKVAQLKDELNLGDITASVLVQRGLDTFDKAKQYFLPAQDQLHDPFLMKDMDKAVERLNQALNNNQRILVYGDYDVDGTTSVALVYAFLSNFTNNLDYYIPDRYKEGYGISTTGIDFAKEHGFDLIIALDCGIKAADKIDYANEKGIDFIICDHHLPPEELPKAAAVLDPKRIDCEYPFKELSGCGVGFKLMQALASHTGEYVEMLDSLFDFLAVSVAADLVEVTGENRVFVSFGLKQLNGDNIRPGLQALINRASVRNELTVRDLVFGIGPRINAAGRIASGKTAVKLLVSQSQKEAEELGSFINESNDTRRDLDRSNTAEALMELENEAVEDDKKSTVVYNENWHKGVVGIVASRLIESHYRPTIVLTNSGEENMACGSARSVEGFDVHHAIEQCQDLLEQFGGHKYAAGLTLPINNIEAFKSKFETVVSSSITEEQLVPEIVIDQEIQLSQITHNFVNILKRMEPFGPGNMQPVFCAKAVVDSGYASNRNGHLKCRFSDSESSQIYFDAIGFNLGHHLDLVKSGEVNIAFHIEENHFRGVTSIQLKLKDIQPA